jgi:hypothetical protein
MKDMIERYIYAVVRRLPEKIQDEVRNELRSNIYDMLPENPKESEIEACLLELGNPRDMAIKYQPVERYLISPRYFGDYIYTLKIVMIIFILVGFSIGLIETIVAHGSSSIWALIGQVISLMFESVFEGIFSAFTIVTIIFVIIEQVQRVEKKEWQIKDLPELPKEGKVKISRAGTVVSIIFAVSFSTVFILILARYHRFIGIYVEDEMIAPFFNPDTIKVFVPLFIAMLVIQIFTYLLKLIDGQWTKRVTTLYTIQEVVNVVLVVLFLTRPNLVHVDFYTELSQILNITIAEVTQGFETGFRVLVIFISILVALDLSTIWYKVLKHDRKALTN